MGRKKAMALPTSVTSTFFETTLKSCAVTNKRFIKIKTLPPKTAALLGVIPQADMRNTMADTAMALTIMVTADSRKRTHISVALLLLDVSATEKKMMAITPISKALKISRNSRSL